MKRVVRSRFLLIYLMILALVITSFNCLDYAQADDSHVWDGTSMDISWYSRNDADRVFEINSPAQLAGLAYIVNQGKNLELDGETSPKQETFRGKTIKLTADISLNDELPTGENSSMHQWPTIAGSSNTSDNKAVFEGTFDGENHTISNMYIYDSTPYSTTYYKNRNRGLFGVTTEYTTIRNVKVTGYICGARGIGGIVGKTGTVVENSYDPNLTGHGTVIKNCINACTITGGESKGIGGIVGAAWNHPVVVGCSNTGNISASPFTTSGENAKYDLPVGGIAGESEGSISSCSNTGSVTGCGGNTGGIVGSSKVSYANIDNCYNTGKISDNKYSSASCAGGIAGWQVGSSSSCYNVGTVALNGPGTSDESVAGGIFGELKSSGTNKGLYWLAGSCSAATGKDSSAVTGKASTSQKTSTYMKSAEFAADMGSAFCQDTDGSNGGYPLLNKITGSLVAIKLTEPTRNTYLVGGSNETFDTTGMKVTAQYDDTSEADIDLSKCELTGFDSSKAQKLQAITVKYGSVSAVFYVHVYTNDSAKTALAAEFAEDDYSGTGWSEVQKILAAAYDKIDVAADGTELQTIMTNAETDIDKIDKLPDISGAVIADIGSVEYTGSQLTPKPASVETPLGAALEEGTDYTVSYSDNTNAGTAKFIITGVRGKYRGTASKAFTISKASQQITAPAAISKAYGSGAFKIGAAGSSRLTYSSSDTGVAAVTATGIVLLKGTGTARITVTAVGNDNYEAASKTAVLTVSPKRAAVSRLRSGKRCLTVKWQKDTKATGYQITCSQSRSFRKGNRTATVKSYKTTAKKIKKLRPGKTYYVRIRAYKTYNGTKIYGAFSKVKKVKVR